MTKAAIEAALLSRASEGTIPYGTTAEVARELAVAPEQVAAAVRRLGLKRRRRSQPSADLDAEIRELAARGAPKAAVAALAKRRRTSALSIRHRMWQMGLADRP